MSLLLGKKRKASEAGIGENDDKEEETPVDLVAELRKQVEFYFGNFNLPYDRWMLNAIKENEGWFPVAKLADFKKIKMSGATQEQIKEAVIGTQMLELNEDQTMCKRTTECPGKEFIKQRTLQAAGFPKKRLDMGAMLGFWKKLCPEVQAVRFFGRGTGVLLVSFSTVELAEEFQAKTGTIQYEDKPIQLGFDLGIKIPKRTGSNKKKRKTGHKPKHLRDGVKNKDLIGVEVGVEKKTDRVSMGPKKTEIVDDWEERAAAERKLLGLDDEEMSSPQVTTPAKPMSPLSFGSGAKSGNIMFGTPKPDDKKEEDTAMPAAVLNNEAAVSTSNKVASPKADSAAGAAAGGSEKDNATAEPSSINKDNAEAETSSMDKDSPPKKVADPKLTPAQVETQGPAVTNGTH